MKMIKARKKFVFSALLSMFAILVILLGIINGTNITLAADDADRITQVLSEGRGAFMNGQARIADTAEAQATQSPETSGEQAAATRGGRNWRFDFGPMGPDSPEMAPSLRYFTFAFDKDGNAECVAWFISAVDKAEAQDWAQSLTDERATGWTRMTYRYRVYKLDGRTYVTVIDQGREMLPVYRILLISLIGLAVGMICSYVLLMYVGRRLFRPLEEADRRQKRFIANAEKEFRLPLTIINANTEIIERNSGETEQTSSINRQVKRMVRLVTELGTLGMFDEKELTFTRVDISAIAMAAADAVRVKLEETGRALSVDAPQPTFINGDSEALSDMLAELMDNAQKFAVSNVKLEVKQQNGHTHIVASNDTALPAGAYDQVFDRFTRLSNAEGLPGSGLGLAHVKEIARAHNGRVSAAAADGVFSINIVL